MSEKMNYTDDIYYNNGPEKAEEFNDLPEQIQNDLLEWYNVREPDYVDKRRLLVLYLSGNFKAWSCEGCGDRVFDGTPDSWDSFQGTKNRDFCYFGNRNKYQSEYLDALCDSCRASSN
jgi:hypothetical protein